MSNNTNEEKVTKITKKQTKIIAIVVAAVAVIIAGVLIISANQTAIYSRLILSFMPESIVTDTEPKTEYFVELGDNLNDEEVKENPLLAFSFYYYDENGNKVDLGPDAKIDDGGSEASLSIVFLLKSALDGNIPNFNDVRTIVIVVAIIIVGIALSIVWFVIWSKNEDKNKAELKAKQNKKSKKNKK